MTSATRSFTLRTLVLAVQGALLLGAATVRAEGEDATPTTRPTSWVELGGLYVDDSSAKFGEYNGLNKKGGYAIGEFGLLGGDFDGTYRYRLFGRDLGLDTLGIFGDVGNQGRWRATFGYDQVPRHYSDQYTTMWWGLGTSSLTLPTDYPAAATRLAVTNTAGGILANWNNIQTPNATSTSTGGGPAFAIPGHMYQNDIGTQRNRANVGGSVILAPGWEASALYKHEEKDGTKLTGVNIGRFSGVSAILPEPISSTTEQFQAAIAYNDKKLNFSLGYYGSIYRNDIKLWTADNPGANNAVMNNVARLQSWPDNEMHQVNFTGGYRFSPYSRFIISGNYSRMTQNSSFIDNPAGSTWVVPVTSPNAKVIQTNLLARYITQLSKDVNFTAAYRYQDRDNRTPVQNFMTTGGDSPGASTLYENEPINRTLQQINLDADWRLARGQGLRAEYEWQEIKRSSTADESPFRADKTTENTLRGVYRNAMSETVTGRLSYAYSQRKVSDYEEGNPRPSNPPAPFPAADPLLGGFEQFFLADRDRQKLRSQLNWQASDSFSLQTTLDLNSDRYTKLQYGLKSSKSWVFGLDGAFQVTDKIVFTGFYTYEDMKMQLDSLAIARGTTATTLVPHVSGAPCAAYTNVANTLPADYYTDPCRNWSEQQKDKVHTLGMGLNWRGLMAGKLDFLGELTWTKATTPISVSGGTYYGNGVPNSPTGNVWIGATDFPDIQSELTQLRLQGFYALNKQSTIRVMYTYGKLKSSDWAYDAYARSLLGVLAVQNYIGPNLTSPNYDVNVVGVSYIYRFR